MTTEANQPRDKKNSDFGLPEAKFQPMAEEGRNWLRIIAVLTGVVLVIGGGGIYWWLNHSPATPPEEAYPMHEEYESEAPKAKVDSNEMPKADINFSEVPKADVEFIDDNTPVKPVEAKQGTQAHELDKDLEVLEEEKFFGTQLAQKPEKGAITKINKPQGRYYIVVSSFIDDDFASDYANQLASQGTDVMLILPAPGKYFYRVALDQEETLYDANEKLEELKANYGKNAWVLKY